MRLIIQQIGSVIDYLKRFVVENMSKGGNNILTFGRSQTKN